MKEIEKRVAALEERIGKLAAAPAAAPAPAPESPREWKSPEEMYEVRRGAGEGREPEEGAGDRSPTSRRNTRTTS